MFEKTKALCESFLKMGVPCFDLLVRKDGEVIFRHMGGYIDVENKIPIKGDELYNIYSCSKPITVTAMMQLWEKGLFDLDDPLYKYLPEYEHMTVKTEEGIVPAKNPILVRQLFTMTAGLTYNLRSPHLLQLREDTQGRCPTREVARYLAREPLAYEPGTQYLYSLAHDVLAALVEVLSGEKFEDYVRKNIFEPMGMTRSDFLMDPAVYDRVATHYRFDAEKGKAVLRDKWPAYRMGTEHASGGAGCVSTVEDYSKFLEGLRTCKLLKKETIDVITRDWHNEEEKKTFPVQDFWYGLGVRMRKPGGVLADFGWGGAAGATGHVDIVNGMTLYYSQHLISSPNQSMRTRVYSAVMADLGYDVPVVIPDNPENNKLTY
ncbi:MAG: beta-lactamase family protein [Oscillospiraceae bacterium]|nr:beta-lactamase family protein [Oscillospiraceae bacterium]